MALLSLEQLYRLIAVPNVTRGGGERQPAVVTPGMTGEVLSLHDGFHLDVADVAPIPPKAIVQFDSVTLMVDQRMKWEKAD